MVIGVLAMLAILALVYASLGQADRRTSTAYVRSVQVQDISNQFGDYIAGIIGDDTMATTVSVGRSFRATSTYPSIPYDDDIKSDKSLGGGSAISYSPVIAGYQPWLAPAEPTFLRFNSATNWTDPDRQYLDFRDWLTISNVAPNGQFVNLANLRNNFFAEPGIGIDSSGRRRMSMGLTLFGPNGLPQLSNAPSLEDGRPADPNVPWHWTARQRHAARPIINFRNAAGQPGPAQDEYYANQWADTDGDGIGDARWFALDTATGPLAQWLTQNLAQQDKARYFAAVRVVDLGGMVNVSTAMDLLDPPGNLTKHTGDAAGYPYGYTPADIDLLRLLTVSDSYQRYGIGYNGLQQPVDPQDAANYSQYTNILPVSVAAQVGTAGYAALQWCTATDRVATTGNPADSPSGEVPTLGSRLFVNGPFATPSDRRATLYHGAQLDPSQVGYTGQVVAYDRTGIASLGFHSRFPFGMAEELELHSYFGVNDPRERSRLEAVLDGRSNSGVTIRPSFGPLRSPRPLEVERDRRGVVRADGQQDDTSLLQQVADVRHNITTINVSRPLTSLSPQSTFNPDVIGDDEVRVNLTPILYPRNGVRPDDSIKRLFNYACDALMPFRGANLWNKNAGNGNAALFYGGSADFTARSAAAWAVNIDDASDNDNFVDENRNGPTAISLRLTQGTDTHTLEYPWEPVTLNNDSELAPSGSSDVESERVNMFGIEAQPFVIEAASYVFWMDVSHSANLVDGETRPRDEWRDGDPDGPGGPLPREDVPITIDHTVSFENADFLGEIVAFQITNPFDREIYITRAGTSSPKFLYYVEYAHRYFPLAELQSGGTGGGGVMFRNVDLKLGPNETRVFYATSPRKEFNFNERMSVGLAANTAPPPGGFLKAWVDRQFRKSTETGTVREPIHTTMFDPETFTMVDPETQASADPENGLMDLHGEHTSPPAMTDDRRVVKLWRVMHSEMSETDTSNLKSNDLLADRLRDPVALGTATLFQRLDSGTNDEVPGTIAGPDDPPGPGGGGPGDPKDNTGYSITMWGAIRRPTNPDALPDHSPRGAMPPWCIEARDDQSYSFSGRSSLNKDFDGPGGRGSRGDYGGSDSRYRTFNALMADQAAGDGGSKVNTEIREKAEDKRLNTIPDSQAIDADGMHRKFNQQAIRIALGGKDASGHIWNSALFRRTGDILLPLAICPYSDPMHSGGSDEMTLSEILALATDYYSPANTHLYFEAGHFDLSVMPQVHSKLDAGHFVLDGFVPYYDVNTNGVFDPSAGNPKEAPIGLGIPVALNLLDKFRFDNFGNKAKGETGKVNINTATLTTLSVLPLLTPDPLTDWMVKADSAQEREPIYQRDMQQSDRAATVEAYRDKVDVRTRPRFTGDNLAPVPNSVLEISFRDSTNTPRFTQPWMQDGRRTHTLIEGLREGLGFRSPGEILAAVLRDRPDDPANYPYRSNSMDWYGHDGESFTGQRGVEPDNVPLVGGGANEETSDKVVDDYGEKIAIANAVINSITTRSDCFCVWFILNGYQPSDVQVGPNDPLTPTFAKRFMMIVDRSNVIKKGDKPRILLFREVPM